jgi:hypothetical protein
MSRKDARRAGLGVAGIDAANELPRYKKRIGNESFDT